MFSQGGIIIGETPLALTAVNAQIKWQEAELYYSSEGPGEEGAAKCPQLTDASPTAVSGIPTTCLESSKCPPAS